MPFVPVIPNQASRDIELSLFDQFAVPDARPPDDELQHARIARGLPHRCQAREKFVCRQVFHRRIYVRAIDEGWCRETRPRALCEKPGQLPAIR